MTPSMIASLLTPTLCEDGALDGVDVGGVDATFPWVDDERIELIGGVEDAAAVDDVGPVDDAEDFTDADDFVVDGEGVSVMIDLTWLTTEYASERKAPKPSPLED